MDQKELLKDSSVVVAEAINNLNQVLTSIANQLGSIGTTLTGVHLAVATQAETAYKAHLKTQNTTAKVNAETWTIVGDFATNRAGAKIKLKGRKAEDLAEHGVPAEIIAEYNEGKK